MPERIKLSRAKGWRKPDGAIIVARGPGRIYCNPWMVGNPGRFDTSSMRYRLAVNLGPSQAVYMFNEWLNTGRVMAIAAPTAALTDAGKLALRDQLHGRRQLILANLETLRGHDLCCWCKPGTPCHADVLLELANK